MDARGGAGSGLGVITAIGKLKAQGGTSSSRYRVPVNMSSVAPATGSNGANTFVIAYTFTLPANSLIAAGDFIKGRLGISGVVTSKTKEVGVRLGGTTIVSRALSNTATAAVVEFQIMATGSGAQISNSYIVESASGGAGDLVSTSVNCTSSTTIAIGFKTTDPGDLTLETLSLELWCV